jgi:hypothetical protein
MGNPIDILHHEIGQAVLGTHPVEEVRDIGVIKAGKDLSLVPEMAKHRFSVHAAFDELDRDLFLYCGRHAQRGRPRPFRRR